MANTVKVDKQGRILVPAEIRRKMGLNSDSEVQLKIIGNELVIRKISSDLRADVERWKQDLLKFPVHIDVVPEGKETDDKWIGKNYAERKLGIR
ncbi:MAG: AbrB/MazE/SpoVT family DNA-binding domain-containing protein [Candidatus Helarchaeota archaeon]